MVQTDKAVEILKSAMLLEMRGKAFYTKVAQQATDGAVRDFFESMAREEDHHIEQLRRQFAHYQDHREFLPPLPSSEPAGGVLNEELRKAISGASYEAAAIGAAISFEERAIQTYAARARETEDPNERRLYEFLCDWEREHLNDLARLDRLITEAAWNDNAFWPW